MNPWRLLRPPLTAGAVLVGQLAHAAYRDDLPSLENQDPSGLFGDPNAPPLKLVYLGDSSVTAPERIADAVESSHQGIALHVSSPQAEAGDMVWVELAISGQRLASEGEYQVVLTWDRSSFDYLDLEADGSGAELISAAAGEARLSFRTDDIHFSTGQPVVVFRALRDASTSSFDIREQNLER
jgi:hypothetical protein